MPSHVNHVGVAHLLSWEGDVGREVMRRVHEFVDVAKVNAPFQPDKPGEHLKDEITYLKEETTGHNLVILVGTHPGESIRGYSWIVQKGSKPHEIRPRNPQGFLKFKIGGRTVYRKRVFHPGTSPDPFLMRWIHLIIH